MTTCFSLFQNLLIFFANLRFFVFSKLFFNIFLKHYRDKSKKHLFSNETSTLSCKRYTPVTGNHNGSATSDNSGIKPKNDSIFIKLRTFQGTIINSDRNILHIILLFPYLLKSHVKICIVWNDKILRHKSRRELNIQVNLSKIMIRLTAYLLWFNDNGGYEVQEHVITICAKVLKQEFSIWMTSQKELP